MAVPVRHLTPAQGSPISVSANATLREAVGLMTEHGVSQLPVIEREGPMLAPRIVTSDSINHALRVFGTRLSDLRVRDALVTARTMTLEDDLFTKMDDLVSEPVVILNGDGSIHGIVTTYDVTQFFRIRAEDMLLVEDIESTLKDHIRNAFAGNEADESGPLRTAIAAISTREDNIRAGCRKSFMKFCKQRGVTYSEDDLRECIDDHFSEKTSRKLDELTLGDLIQVARRPEAWAVLSTVFGIPDEAFREMMDGVRRTRNKLMHFRPDIHATEREHLRFCADWFKNHPPQAPEDAVGATAAAVEAAPAAAADVGTVAQLEDECGQSIGEPEPGDSGESKYAPLAYYLVQRPQTAERIVLSFADVEEILGTRLPAAAREHRAWWANDTTAHVQSEQWLGVNWRVVSINMSEQRVTFARARDREQAYIRFFSSVQAKLRDVADFALSGANPLGVNWLELAHYRSSSRFLYLSFARGQRVRLECYIDSGNAAKNDQIFEAMLMDQAAFEVTVGAPLEWERLPKRRACRVALYREGTIDDSPEELAEVIQWVERYAPAFDQAIRQTPIDPEILPSRGVQPA